MSNKYSCVAESSPISMFKMQLDPSSEMVPQLFNRASATSKNILAALSRPIRREANMSQTCAKEILKCCQRPPDLEIEVPPSVDFFPTNSLLTPAFYRTGLTFSSAVLRI